MRRREGRWAPAVALYLLCFGVTVGVEAPAQANSTTNESRSYFYEAEILWESEAEVVSGALQNVPLVAAMADLERGLHAGHGDTTGYASAIATIRDFEDIPLTSESPSQMKDARRDWSRLNAFFKIGPAQAAVLMDDGPLGAYYDMARKAFRGEPQRNRDGVDSTLLKLAVSDLQDEELKQPTRVVVYVAAIDDLENLEGASASEIASSASGLDNPYGQDILYLNVFFKTTRLTGTSSTYMAKAAK